VASCGLNGTDAVGIAPRCRGLADLKPSATRTDRQESPRKRTAPAVSVVVKASSSHAPQDLQSLTSHQEAIKLMRSDPKLVDQALATLDQWRSSGNSHSQLLAAKRSSGPFLPTSGSGYLSSGDGHGRTSRVPAFRLAIRV